MFDGLYPEIIDYILITVNMLTSLEASEIHGLHVLGAKQMVRFRIKV